MADIKIMKAVEFDKTSAKFRKRFTSAQQAHEAGWIMQPKFDGCYGIAVLDEKARMLSRTGEDYSTSCLHILAALCSLLPSMEYAVVGEVWDPNDEFKNISGRFRRQSVSDDKLVFMVHDLLPLDYNTDTPYHVRYNMLKRAFSRSTTNDISRVQLVHTTAASTDVLATARRLKDSGGYDGVMLKDPMAPYTVGLAKEGQLIKVKPSLSLDLRVDAVHEAVGEKTGRPVFTISVTYRGKTSMVGSGMPHSRAALPQPGQIVEVEAMGLTPEGLLREPRFKGIRFDKEQPDT